MKKFSIFALHRHFETQTYAARLVLVNCMIFKLFMEDKWTCTQQNCFSLQHFQASGLKIHKTVYVQHCYQCLHATTDWIWPSLGYWQVGYWHVCLSCCTLPRCPREHCLWCDCSWQNWTEVPKCSPPTCTCAILAAAPHPAVVSAGQCLPPTLPE